MRFDSFRVDGNPDNCHGDLRRDPFRATKCDGGVSEVRGEFPENHGKGNWQHGGRFWQGGELGREHGGHFWKDFALDREHFVRPERRFYLRAAPSRA